MAASIRGSAHNKFRRSATSQSLPPRHICIWTGRQTNQIKQTSSWASCNPVKTKVRRYGKICKLLKDYFDFCHTNKSKKPTSFGMEHFMKRQGLSAILLTTAIFISLIGCQKKSERTDSGSTKPNSSSKSDQRGSSNSSSTAGEKKSSASQSPLRNWQQLVQKGPCFGLTAEQIQKIFKLDSPPTKNTEYGECKFEWKEGNKKRYVRVVAIVKNVDAGVVLANAKVMKKLAEEGSDIEAVDLSSHGVWAYWDQRHRQGKLSIYSQTMHLQINAMNAFDKNAERKTLAKSASKKIAELLFAK